MFRSGAALANSLWLASSLPAWRRYRRSASQIEATQRSILATYLRDNANTEFGKQHRFDDLDSYEAFASRVPVATYDEHLPWLDRIVAGEANILTVEPVRLLEPSSGSTGPRKLLPYTRKLQLEFRRAIAAWTTQTMLDDPTLIGGKAYWSLTPSIDIDESVDSSIPVGFDEDSAYLGGIAQRIINKTLVAPEELRQLQDTHEFRMATLACLIKASDLRLISVWHPSFLLILLKQMRSHWQTLVSTVRNGGTFGNGLLRITPDRRRAAELSLVDPHDNKSIWPDLGLVSCWADAHAKTYAREIQRELPDVTVQPKGLVATEAIVSIPMAGKHPLAVCSHFFEFLREDGKILPAWQLDAGETYSLLVTTGGGLYRYRLGDHVRINDHYSELPCIEFLGKDNAVSDHFGEKLSEPFVASVLDQACREAGVAPSFIMVAFDDSSKPPGYRIFIESGSDVPVQLAERVDEGLKHNPHYELCIRLDQLRPVDMQRIPAGAYDSYCDRFVRQGMRLGGIKPAALSSLGGWSDWFATDRQAVQ